MSFELRKFECWLCFKEGKSLHALLQNEETKESPELVPELELDCIARQHEQENSTKNNKGKECLFFVICTSQGEQTNKGSEYYYYVG